MPCLLFPKHHVHAYLVPPSLLPTFFTKGKPPLSGTYFYDISRKFDVEKGRGKVDFSEEITKFPHLTLIILMFIAEQGRARIYKEK